MELFFTTGEAWEGHEIGSSISKHKRDGFVFSSIGSTQLRPSLVLASGHLGVGQSKNLMGQPKKRLQRGDKLCHCGMCSQLHTTCVPEKLLVRVTLTQTRTHTHTHPARTHTQTQTQTHKNTIYRHIRAHTQRHTQRHKRDANTRERETPTRMHTHTHTCTHAHAHVRKSTRAHTHTHPHSPTHSPPQKKDTHTQTHAFTHPQRRQTSHLNMQ